MEFKSHRKECPKLLSFRNRAIRSTGSMMVALATVLIGFSSTPSHAQSNSSASSSSCAGKLGVHRTIKVSNKNTTLVGVDNHGRIGLRPKELVLTFDDGPREGSTQKILKALAAECVKATFFSLGRSARSAPHLVRRTAREGHTIATHSQSHPLLTKRNNDGVRAEIRRGVKSIDVALEGSNYKASNFFRYPFLDRSKRTDAIVREMGLVAFHMNIDSWDWRKQTPSAMVALTMRRVRAEGSGIVLFHDIQDKTAAGLPEFLRTIKREGYKIVHIVPGNSNFDYRRDVASRQTAKPVQTVKLSEQSSIQELPALKKTKIVRKRTLKAPHPKRKPRDRRITSVRKTPIDKARTTQSLSRANDDLPTPAPVFEEQLASGNPVAAQPPKKKRFRLLRKIFGKRN
ncbi:MAG: polysaccharide deacetylase family protein [Hyphomicrobiales bacterium]